ncbi:MAG: response regulator [Nitrospinae bacterium]|nr:response regulator [Nitrospinota bacterium]
MFLAGDLWLSAKSALNGKLSLQVLSEWKPDLIITDIFMPEMDGFDLCREVKSDPCMVYIPLVFYTATYTSVEDKELGILLGTSQFIIKPQ